jgi:hypothetical protein
MDTTNPLGHCQFYKGIFGFLNWLHIVIFCNHNEHDYRILARGVTVY